MRKHTFENVFSKGGHTFVHERLNVGRVLALFDVVLNQIADDSQVANEARVDFSFSTIIIIINIIIIQIRFAI